MKKRSIRILLLLLVATATMPLQAQSEDLDRRFDNLRKELKGDIADLKSELKGDIADLKDLIREGFSAVNRRIDNLWVLFYWFFGGIGGILGAFLVPWLKKSFAFRVAK